MNSKSKNSEKLIPLTDQILLPPKICYHHIEDKHLFIAPGIPSWIVTNDVGAFMLAPLQEGYTIGEALGFSISELDMEREEALAEMKDLLEEIEAKKFYKNTKPRELNLEESTGSLHLFLTRKCNIRCIHCYMDGGDSMADELSLEEWKSVIDVFTELYGKSVITLSGGEPLCRNDFYDIVTYAKEKEQKIYLLTNGTLIQDKETAERIAKMVDHIQISLDGASKETVDRVRGKGVFDKVVAAIKLLKPYEMKIQLAFTILPENLKDLEKNLIPFIRSLDYPKITVNIDDSPSQLGRAVNFSKDAFLMPVKARKPLNVILTQLWAHGWSKKTTGTLNKRVYNCGIGNGFSVDANGDIYPCPMPICKSGNLRRDNLIDVAKKIFLLNEETSVEHMEKCGDCELKYICVGGCRLSNYQVNGDFLMPSCTQFNKDKLYHRMIDRWI